MKSFLKAISIAFIVSGVIYLIFAAYYLVTFGHLDIVYFKSKETMLGISYGVCLYLVHGWTSDLIRRLWPSHKDFHKRTLVFIPWCIILTFIVVFILNYVFYVLAGELSFGEFLRVQRWSAYIPLVIIALVVAFVFYASAYYKEYKDRQVAQHKQIAGGATAQLETLKSQIDPHFLFNSLNVLVSLIEEDQDKAIDYTTSLSKIYRYILEQKDKELISVREELRFADSFVTLLKLRFEDAIHYEVIQEGFTANMMTIPLVLQLLLENAIKHNVATEENILRIYIGKEDEYLVVSNNVQEKEGMRMSTKVGLRNIQERYALLTDIPVEIVKTKKSFKVRLPILRLS